MTAATLTEDLSRPLTIEDRCDSCGAQAFVRVLFRAGELTFCGHHGRALRVPLQRDALLYEDSTDTINAKPSPSANSD